MLLRNPIVRMAEGLIVTRAHEVERVWTLVRFGTLVTRVPTAP
jgi:hypothetical protein